MEYDSSHRMETGPVRITITLNRNVYEHIKKISGNMGLRPSTWMTMICTSKVNNIQLSINNELSDIKSDSRSHGISFETSDHAYD